MKYFHTLCIYKGENTVTWTKYINTTLIIFENHFSQGQEIFFFKKHITVNSNITVKMLHYTKSFLSV